VDKALSATHAFNEVPVASPAKGETTPQARIDDMGEPCLPSASFISTAQVRCKLRERPARRSGVEHDQNGWSLAGHASVDAVNRFRDGLPRDKVLSVPAPFLEGELP